MSRAAPALFSSAARTSARDSSTFPDPQRPRIVHRQPELLRVDLVLADPPVLELADHGLAAERDLVHPVLAVDHHHVPAPEPLQHAHLDADQVGMEHAHQLLRRAARDW